MFVTTRDDFTPEDPDVGVVKPESTALRNVFMLLTRFSVDTVAGDFMAVDEADDDTPDDPETRDITLPVCDVILFAGLLADTVAGDFISELIVLCDVVIFVLLANTVAACGDLQPDNKVEAVPDAPEAGDIILEPFVLCRV